MNRKTHSLSRAAYIVFIVAFMVSLAWVRIGTPLFFAGWALALVGALLLEGLHQRALDEVELAAERFSMHWGSHIGALLMLPLVLLPPSQSFILSVESWLNQPGNGPLPTAVSMVLLGTAMLWFLQLASKSLLVSVWKFLKR